MTWERRIYLAIQEGWNVCRHIRKGKEGNLLCSVVDVSNETDWVNDKLKESRTVVLGLLSHP